MAAERGAEARDEGAFHFLFSEVVEHIMALADNPRGCVDYIATEIRDIVAARTILVLDCPDMTGGAAHRLVSALPERRGALAEDPAFHGLLEKLHALDRGAFVAAGDGTEIGRGLAELGVGDSIILPLRYAGAKTGIILLLDLLDRANVRSLLSTFDRLSPILALIMRNAYLYENLEAEVERRTRELEAKNAVIEASLREKEVLLKEIHHRVKNNLQIVNSLLYLRMAGIEDEGTRALFAESQNRILAMSLVHEELYRAPDLSRVDMRDYLAKLVGRLVSVSSIPIEASFELESVLLSPDEAIPCGLLVDELVMNAMKHAFVGRASGRLRVSLRRSPAGIELEVEDDGPGMDASLLEGGAAGLGLSIIRSLVDQLRATLALGPGPGARFKLTLPAGPSGD